MATRTAAAAPAARDRRGETSETGRRSPTGLSAYVALAFLLSWGWLVPTALARGEVWLLMAATTVLVILGATALVPLELVRTRTGHASVLLPGAPTGLILPTSD